MSSSKTYPLTKQSGKGNIITEAERSHWFARWQSSGLTKKEFCAQHHLSKSFFYPKSGAFNPKKSSKKTASDWIPVVSQKQEVGSSKTLVEVILSNQVIVRLEWPVSDVGYLLKELGHAATIVR